MLKIRLGCNAMRHRCLQSSDDGLDPYQARRQWSNWNISTCWLAASTARFIDLLLDLPELVGGAPSPQSVAACLSRAARRILSRMGTKSRETIYGASVRAAAERAAEGRRERADFA